jgi:signal transduction histidine kinase
MLTSLRSRLWFSHALVVGVALFVVGAGFFWAIQRTPFIYRQTILHLLDTENLAIPNLEPLIGSSRQKISLILTEQAAKQQVRLALIQTDGKILFDSGGGKQAELPIQSIPLISSENDPLKVTSFRDNRLRLWLYTLKPVGKDYFLMAAVLRPALLAAVLRDDIYSPVIIAGGIALLTAFLLSLWLSNWIARPLQKISSAARAISKDEYPAVPIEGPGEVRDMAKAFSDMSQKVKASQQSQKDFVSNVSHELKTPLTSIQGFAQAILDGTAQTPEALHQAASVIQQEANRMHRLVMDLLTLARLEGGTADLEKQPVDLGEIIRQIVDNFSLQAQKAGIHLELKKEKNLPIIRGDGDRLVQVFTNLVDNALKFTPQNGEVIVNADASAGYLFIRVTDSGPGITPEDQKRIFERFFQTDRSRKGGANHGIGLGLPIAREIVRAHGGEVWVESNPGRGSVFVVKLPVEPSLSAVQIHRRG